MAERLFPILYLELNAVGLTILLIVLFSRQRTGHGSADQRFFSALALSDAAMLALDTAMWLLDGQRFSLAQIWRRERPNHGSARLICAVCARVLTSALRAGWRR